MIALNKQYQTNVLLNLTIVIILAARNIFIRLTNTKKKKNNNNNFSSFHNCSNFNLLQLYIKIDQSLKLVITGLVYFAVA